jgi:hypothetical protein
MNTTHVTNANDSIIPKPNKNLHIANKLNMMKAVMIYETNIEP